MREYTGLENRGERPDPDKRNALSKWIYIEFDRYMRDARVYISHEMFTGVPCGPTLAMVDPRCLGYYTPERKERMYVEQSRQNQST